MIRTFRTWIVSQYLLNFTFSSVLCNLIPYRKKQKQNCIWQYPINSFLALNLICGLPPSPLILFCFCVNPHSIFFPLIFRWSGREERRGEKERRSIWEKHWLVASHMNPWLVIEPETLQCVGWCSNHWSTLARAPLSLLILFLQVQLRHS